MLTSSRMSNRYVFAGAGIARPPTFGLRNALRVRGRALCAPTVPKRAVLGSLLPDQGQCAYYSTTCFMPAQKFLCQHRAEPVVRIVGIPHRIRRALPHHADNANVHAGIKPIHTRQQRACHIDHAIAGKHPHDLAFHLLPVQDVHILFR